MGALHAGPAPERLGGPAFPGAVYRPAANEAKYMYRMKALG